jgi:hypothetical protein
VDSPNAAGARRDDTPYARSNIDRPQGDVLGANASSAFSRVDVVACELAAKLWGGAWRTGRSCATTRPNHSNEADSSAQRPDVDTCGRADDSRIAA